MSIPRSDRKTRVVAALFAVAAFAGACSSGPNEIAEADLEEQVALQLAAEVKQPKPDIDCPEGLEAKVGAAIDCTLQAQGDTAKYNVNVKVDSVDEDTKTAHYTIKVADKPNE